MRRRIRRRTGRIRHERARKRAIVRRTAHQADTETGIARRSVKIIGEIRCGGCADFRRQAAQQVRRIFLDVTLRARQFRREQHALGVRPTEPGVKRRRDIRARFFRAHVDNETPADAPQVPERVYETEKHRDGCRVHRRAVAFRHAVLHDADSVAFFQTDGGRDDRIIPVVIAPVRHIRDARPEPALIQTVRIEFGVVCRLRVPRAEDDAHRVLHDRAGNIPTRLPALAALAGDRTETTVRVRRRRHSEHGFLGRIVGKVGISRQHAAVAAAVSFIGGNDRAELLVGAVDHSGTEPRNTARRHVNRFLARNRLERDRLDRAVPLFPRRVIVRIPAPHALPLRAVELCRTAVLVAVGIRRVELAAHAVVRHEVATEPQFFRQLFEGGETAVIPGSDRRRVRLVPIPTRDRVARRLDRFGEVHAPRLAALVLHGYRHIREFARSPRQLVDSFRVLKRRKHRPHVVFFLFRKCHCCKCFMLKVCCFLPSRANRRPRL